MNIRFVKSSEKKQILQDLNEQFGIEKLNYLLIEAGKEKIRGFSGSLSKEEIQELGRIVNIEVIGLYLIKKERSKSGKQELRLSFDSPTLFKTQIAKNIVDIDDNQLSLWIRGNDLDLESPEGAVIIKHNDDFIGCGRSNGLKIFNYVPKDRRLKK